jgi:nitrogen fixation-related uncharacterized protein
MHNWIVLLILLGIALVVSIIVILGVFLFTKDSDTEDDSYTFIEDEEVIPNDIQIKKKTRRKPWYKRKKFREVKSLPL